MLDTVTPIAQFFASPDTKFYLALVGVLWTAFKGVTWVKDIREKDLKGIDGKVDNVGTEIRTQTSAMNAGFTGLSATVDRGFQELRSDFRTFYTSPDPLMVPVRARATKKRKSTAMRKDAKATPRKAKAK